MAWNKVIDEADAAGKLKELYQQNREAWGGVDNILKIHSLAPETLSAHLVLYKTLMHGPGELSRLQREMIAVVVSALNHCHY
jgi:uncharacterized peroxidase-related enzyme